ncbi:ead/Ea22-like family protein [Raoultella ornithinolytica]|uniref:ead/Ea22-like family protein n=1 Tax=Raoultella ornithinolytica TaxID=54291 RepID=UPI002DB9B9AA|nr:ead/Ea22-like family protein [Raoultella ornithinolytica]MEB7941408.1 ead/Ea22-like family protein [Raoultella ornithinolytica]
MTTDITELAQRLNICAKEGTYPVLSPADCGALVEALEKAQQYAKERDAENQDLMLTVGRLRVEREELESRTVKLPEAFYPDGDIDCPLAINVDDVKDVLTAAGIKWEAE